MRAARIAPPPRPHPYSDKPACIDRSTRELDELSIADDSLSDDEGVPISPMVKAMHARDMQDTDIDELSQTSGGESPAITSLGSSMRQFGRGCGRVPQSIEVDAGVSHRGPRTLRFASGEGITCTSVPECLRHPDLGGAYEVGVLVEAVDIDSAAARSGLLVGDIILSVNGIQAREHAQVCAVLRRATQRGEPVTLLVVDQSKQLIFDKACGTLGLTCEHAPETAAPHVAVVVTAMKSESMCRAAGLCVGHVLLSINGVLVETHQVRSSLDAAARPPAGSPSQPAPCCLCYCYGVPLHVSSA